MIVIFATATKVTTRNGEISLFWDSPWMEGRCPKDIAPLIYAISKRKKAMVATAIGFNFGVCMIDVERDFGAGHIAQFITLLEKLEHVHLHQFEPDTIV